MLSWYRQQNHSFHQSPADLSDNPAVHPLRMSCEEDLLSLVLIFRCYLHCLSASDESAVYSQSPPVASIDSMFWI